MDFARDVGVWLEEACAHVAAVELGGGATSGAAPPVMACTIRVITRDEPPLELTIAVSAAEGARCTAARALGAAGAPAGPSAAGPAAPLPSGGSPHEVLMQASPAYGRSYLGAVAAKLAAMAVAPPADEADSDD
jgi:hypothetical protein